MLGPLSRTSEPHSYDLCAEHSARLTVPRGWRVIRVPGAEGASDDLVALADALNPRSALPVAAPREDSGPAGGAALSAEEPASGRPQDPHGPSVHSDAGTDPSPRHLRVVRSPDE